MLKENEVEECKESVREGYREEIIRSKCKKCGKEGESKI